MGMKVLAAKLASLCLYWAGHAISCVMNNAVGAYLYPIYNRLMIWSSEIEEWAGIDFMWRR